MTYNVTEIKKDLSTHKKSLLAEFDKMTVENQSIPDNLSPKEIVAKTVDTIVPVIVKLMDYYGDLIVNLAGRIDTIAKEKDRELENLIQEVMNLKDEFRKMVANLPDALQANPDIRDFVNRHENSIKDVLRKAYTDNLTGLYNRNHLFNVLHEESGNYVGFILDIDHFKKVNDTYGHDAGDAVLRKVSSVIRQHCIQQQGRKVIPFRLGGEEIGILLKVRSEKGHKDFSPEEEVKYVHAFAEKTRQKIESELFGFLEHGKTITVSIGVSDRMFSLPVDGKEDIGKDSFGHIFGDENLYKAKETGRNKVVIDSGALSRNITIQRDEQDRDRELEAMKAKPGTVGRPGR